MARHVIRCDAAICPLLGAKRKSLALARNDVNDPGCVKTLRGKTVPGILGPVVMRRAKKHKNLSSARHDDQIGFRFRTAKTRHTPRRQPGRKLPAGDTHVAVNGGALVTPVDDEVVSFGFAIDSGSDCLFEELVALGTAQGRSEVGGVLLAQAHEERSGSG